MSSVVMQRFPRQQDGQLVHVTWAVDLDAALRCHRGDGLDAKRLLREAREMAEHLPRWVLTVATAHQLVSCRACGGTLVFDRGLVCVACGKALSPKQLGSGARLAWFGLLPPIGIDGLPAVRAALGRRQPRQHVVGRRDEIGTFLLVPLIATYPVTFPRTPVEVSYLPGMFSIAGMPEPAPSHTCHLLSGGQMCLFAGGQWRADSSAREVLQQRAYAHAVKLLNYANGKRNAFAIVS